MNTFCNLTLTFKPSALENITLNEYIDVNVLEKLINSTLLKETFHNPYSAIHKTEKNQLLKYKSLLKNNEYAVVKYNRVKGMEGGRVNPENSLGLYSIRREIRHTLAKHRYTDLDIDNCHPVLLNQILIKNNMSNKYLDSYVKNRQDWFNNVIECFKIDTTDSIKKKEIPKALFIRIMYGGGLQSWMKDFNIDPTIKPFTELTNFINEMKTNMECITGLNPELKQKILDRKELQNKTDYNICGSVCSYYLQQKECDILEELYIYSRKNNLIQNDSCVLCADGLMIETEFYKPTLLNEFKTLIKNKYEIEVDFSEKKMNQDYLTVLEESLDFKLYYDITTTGILANYFKTIYANEFIVVNDQLYNYTGVYWQADESKKSTKLHQFISNTFYKHMVKYTITQKSIIFKQLEKAKGEDEETTIKQLLQKLNTFEEKVNMFCNSVHFRNNLIEDIKHHITTNVKLDDKPFLFVFNNKIYDLQKGEWKKPNPYDYLTVSCGYDYIEYYDENNIIELNNIIDTIFTKPDVKNYYLECLSTGLYGAQVENLFIATGAGGNGKSLLNSLMMKAIGPYGYKLPSSVLMAPIKDGGNPQIANINKKRFCLGQEPDKNKTICSSTMKELTGDDSINSRKLYSGECEVKLTASLFIECNELPKMDEVNDAIIRRVRVIPFTSKFVDAGVYNSMDSSDITNNNVFVGNTFYKSDEFKIKYRQALLMILFNKFKNYVNNKMTLSTPPKACIEACNDYLSLSDDIFDWFSNTYEKTDDGVSFIYYKDVYGAFSSSAYFQNLSKKEKRENNLKRFSSKIDNCVFLTKHIRSRDSYYNGTRHKSPYIIGYKIPLEEEPEPEQTPNPLDS